MWTSNRKQEGLNEECAADQGLVTLGGDPAAVYLGLGTPEGWNSPLSQLGEGWFTYTPYDLQVWQYFLYKLLFVCLGMAAVALMASFFSLLTRSALYASTVSLLLLFTAYGALFVTDSDTVFSWFSLTYALNPRMIFSDYVSFWLPGDEGACEPSAQGWTLSGFRRGCIVKIQNEK